MPESFYRLERICNVFASPESGIGLMDLRVKLATGETNCPAVGDTVYVKLSKGGPNHAVGTVLDKSLFGKSCEACGSCVSRSSGIKVEVISPSEYRLATLVRNEIGLDLEDS